MATSHNAFANLAAKFGIASLIITMILMPVFSVVRHYLNLADGTMTILTVVAVIWLVLHILVQIAQALMRKNAAGELGILDQNLSLIPFAMFFVLLTMWFDGHMTWFGWQEWVILFFSGALAVADLNIERVISILLARRSISGLGVGDTNNN